MLNIIAAQLAPTTPNTFSVDYLVVAGGGGGGFARAAGGGAGGLRSTVTATGGGGSLETTLTLAASTNYTVTIGTGRPKTLAIIFNILCNSPHYIPRISSCFNTGC